MWRKLLKYRELARDFVRIDIHNGASTSFWYDVWTQRGRLIDITGLRGCIDLGIPSYASVEVVLNSHRRKHHRLDIYNTIERVIEEERVKETRHGEDVVMWRRRENTFQLNFHTSSTWQQVRDGKPNVVWSKSLWYRHATPKYAFHAWLAIQNRLTTGDRMLKWNVGADGTCVFCQHNLETRNHIYFECRFTEEIWRPLTHKLLMQKFTLSWERIMEILVDDAFDTTTQFLIRYVFHTTLHTIWRERNKRRHGESALTAANLITFIDKQVRNRLSTIRRKGDDSLQGGLEAWFASR